MASRTRNPQSRKIKRASRKDPLVEEAKAAIAAAADEQAAEEAKSNERTSLELIYGKAGPPQMDPLAEFIENQFPNQRHPFGSKEIIVPALPKPPLLPAPEPKHRVTVMKDTVVQYPDLYLEIFIHGEKFEDRAFAPLFTRAHCTRAKSPLEADIVVFTGGADVNPAYYGENPHRSTRFDDKRDEADMMMYLMCLEEGIPMVGVCRGAQFLSVMNGGKLYQDLDNHYGDHAIFDLASKRRIEKVSSVHHQAVRSNIEGGMEIIAVTSRSMNRWLNDKESEEKKLKSDIEAFFYRDTCCLGFQGHPEYLDYPHYAQYFLDKVNEYINHSPDTDWINKNRRLKPEFIAERDARIAQKKTEKN